MTLDEFKLLTGANRMVDIQNLNATITLIGENAILRDSDGELSDRALYAPPAI